MIDAPDDALARFVALEKERRELEERLAELQHESAAVAARLLDEWADRGQQNAKVDGMTVYVAMDFYCSKRTQFTTPEVCEILTRNGLDYLVGPAYNASSLKSWVKEQLTEGTPLPEELAAAIQYDEIPRLRTRRG